MVSSNQSVQLKILQEDQIPQLTIGWLDDPMGGQLREVYCVFYSCIQSETSQFSHGQYRVVAYQCVRRQCWVVVYISGFVDNTG